MPPTPTIILSSGLGGSAAYWAPQLPALVADYRVITYDHRGTGRTGGTVPYGGGIAAMADDVMEIASKLNLKRFDFMGHALGGLIGLHLALKQPQLIGKLVLINAWSKADPHSGRCFDTRIELLENPASRPSSRRSRCFFIRRSGWQTMPSAWRPTTNMAWRISRVATTF